MRIFGTGYRENIREQGTGRICENRVQGECLRMGCRVNESSVLGKYLRTEYWENIWNRLLGRYLRTGYWENI